MISCHTAIYGASRFDTLHAMYKVKGSGIQFPTRFYAFPADKQNKIIKAIFFTRFILFGAAGLYINSEHILCSFTELQFRLEHSMLSLSSNLWIVVVGFDVDLDELWDFVILEFCNKTHTIQYGYDTGRDQPPTTKWSEKNADDDTTTRHDYLLWLKCAFLHY